MEEGLFAVGADLSPNFSVVFMSTPAACPSRTGAARSLVVAAIRKTTARISIEMIVGLVIDQDGRPLCCELWPSNTANVTTLLPVVDQLRAGHVGRMCVVADRGMISAREPFCHAGGSARLEYVLGVRRGAAVPKYAAP